MALERLHLLGLLLVLMVVTHEVQAAMGEQQAHLVGRGVAKARCLVGHDLGADDDVPEHQNLVGAVLELGLLVGVVDPKR